MKTLKKNAIIAMIFFLFASVSFSQTTTTTKKTSYPNWIISPVGGIAFPVGELSESFDPGGSFGLDATYRVNREVGFYGKVGYYFLGSKVSGTPDGKFFEYTVGPKYYFTSRNLKSSIYLEAGLGAYTFMQDSYVLNDITNPEVSETKFGYNAGLGAILNLGRDVDMKFETKYTSILTTNGSSSFISPVLGLDVRF